MKTALLTLGLTALFFALGVVGVRVVLPRLSGDAEAAPLAETEGATHAEVGEVAGEVADLRRQLGRAEARADSLRDVIEGRQLDDQAAGARAAELAATLTKLDDEALGGIVQRLDGGSFVKLFEAASSRNQVRLLDALTPAQAAAFVRHQLPGGAALKAETPEADAPRADAPRANAPKASGSSKAGAQPAPADTAAVR